MHQCCLSFNPGNTWLATAASIRRQGVPWGSDVTMIAGCRLRRNAWHWHQVILTRILSICCWIGNGPISVAIDHVSPTHPQESNPGVDRGIRYIYIYIHIQILFLSMHEKDKPLDATGKYPFHRWLAAIHKTAFMLINQRYLTHGQVHAGYRDEVWQMSDHNIWPKITKKLAKCSSFVAETKKP